MAADIDQSSIGGTTISLGHSLARSKRFDALFTEGMKLVEEAADYLDGAGRADARCLRTALKSAYAAESMRLTTRLMQIASWLLIRRAIADKNSVPDPAATERARLNLSAQHLVSSPAILAQLPEQLQRLAASSLRLQTRVLHLDHMVNLPIASVGGTSRVNQQIELLRSAFGSIG